MATERTTPVTTPTGSKATWMSWLAALAGLWVLVTPFVLSGPVDSGAVLWSNVIAGGLVVGCAAYTAYRLRSTAEAVTWQQWSGWLAAVIGLWVLASPFVLTGTVATSSVMWSNVIAGILILVLAVYAGVGLDRA